MNATARSLGIDQLSLAERILLVEEIWDSIAAEVEAPDIPQSHRDELDRRLAAEDANPGDGASWEEAKARLRKPLGVSTVPRSCTCR
ncbi:MAG: addiction module protein [Armatimonadetes bacterium]|nr:addiction module protein [Armatimonadota bacterium]